MGWAYGLNATGREIGYSIEATCDESGCTEEIDRGLAYVCGGMHDGGEHGCGGYFCGHHLFVTCPPVDRTGLLCARCIDAADDEDDR
jgi:hypothetical protein